ncbi:MAG: hypothetical protein P0107_03100 [Nitrosomonas sp.]|nr:hypothetical protein [Nitrosomonas sp.]
MKQWLLPVCITVGVGWLYYTCCFVRRQDDWITQVARVILWLGAIGPTIVAGRAISNIITVMKTLPMGADDLEIAVDGKQFWWRVRYLLPDGRATETANEIRVFRLAALLTLL